MKIYLCGVKSENRSVAGTDKGRRADQKSSIPKFRKTNECLSTASTRKVPISSANSLRLPMEWGLFGRQLVVWQQISPKKQA